MTAIYLHFLCAHTAYHISSGGQLRRGVRGSAVSVRLVEHTPCGPLDPLAGHAVNAQALLPALVLPVRLRAEEVRAAVVAELSL